MPHPRASLAVVSGRGQWQRHVRRRLLPVATGRIKDSIVAHRGGGQPQSPPTSPHDRRSRRQTRLRARRPLKDTATRGTHAGTSPDCLIDQSSIRMNSFANTQRMNSIECASRNYLTMHANFAHTAGYIKSMTRLQQTLINCPITIRNNSKFIIKFINTRARSFRGLRSRTWWP